MIKASLLCSLLALGYTTALPSLELPWGKYEAQVLADDPEIYFFQNVRFGEVPERFQASRIPTTTNDSVQSPTDGRSCIQIDLTKFDELPGDEEPVDGPGEDSEDCLFLDLYVPKWVFEEDEVPPLPVVVWIYGGAFAFGAKDQAGVLYSGRSIITASDYQTIFVTGNYRLGAFGWLAGDYMQKSGTPNAGLYDQALLFEWVQKHISKVHGNKDEVSAWGQSAGASSILHHLIRENGTVDPTFKTFATLSPAFQWAWDNKPNGNLDQVYQRFSELADCGKEFNMTCLRQAESTKLIEANQELYKTLKTTGLFPLGPSVDSKWVNTLPTLAFANGQHWDAEKINSAIVSHTLNEATMFTPKHIKNTDTFQAFLSAFLPGSSLAEQRKKISLRYNLIRFLGDWKRRTATIIRDASFTCNTRDLFSAYKRKTHMMRYAFPDQGNAKHGADLVPLFTNNQEEAVDFMKKLNASEGVAQWYSYKLFNDQVAQTYQNYFASFAVSGGDPNTMRDKLGQGVIAPVWTPAKDANELENVLTVRLKDLLQRPFVTTVPDGQNTQEDCDFWKGIAEEVMAAQNSGLELVGDEEENDG